MKKKVIALVALALVCVFAFAACSGEAAPADDASAATEEAAAPADDAPADEADAPADEADAPADETPAEEDATEEDAAADGDKLLIGCNNYLKGIYSLDILEKAFLQTCDALDVEGYVVNDEGQLENTTSNVDNMIAAGVDGIVFFGISDTLFEVVAEKCDAAGVPFVFYDHMPADEILTSVKQYPTYKGVAGTVDLNTGNNIGGFAAEEGKAQAVVVTGLQTDPTHSARTNGFEETFVAGGGTVLEKSYGDIDLSSVMTRANDVLTANSDADAIYATNGDVGTACIEALAKHPDMEASLYVTDLDPDILTGLENGTVAAANGAHWVNVDYATALLVNSLRGNDIVDENGEAPRLVVPVMTLPSNLVGMYNTYWIENHPYSNAELQALVGADVTIDAFQKMLDDYNIMNRLEAKVADGDLSQEDLDAALAS